MQRDNNRRVQAGVLRVLLCVLWVMVGMVSASNNANPVCIPDVIGLVSRFLDLSDLFGFRQVCRLFDEWAHITVAQRVGVHRPIDNSHRVHLVSLKDETAVLKKLDFYQGWNDHRTLIQFEDKHLLVRGVGTHVNPGYTGRCLVKRRGYIETDFSYPEMIDFSSKTDPEWMWDYQSKCGVSFHSGLKIHSPHEIIAVRMPFFVAHNGEFYRLYRINNGRVEDPSLLAEVEGEYELVWKFRLFSDPNSKNGWPMMIDLPSSEIVIIDFELGTVTTHPIPGVSPSDHVAFDWLDSPDPLVMCVISNQHCWRVINLQTGKTISESVIPLRSYIENGPRKVYSDSEGKEERERDLSHPYYYCECNGRYGFIRLSYEVGRAVKLNDGSLLYDLQTGELIGSGIGRCLSWISEELFSVCYPGQCIVRSIHQPRKDIKCIMVDEHGNEQPLQRTWAMSVSQVLNLNFISLNPSGPLVFVEWEKSVLPSEKRHRTHLVGWN